MTLHSFAKDIRYRVLRTVSAGKGMRQCLQLQVPPCGGGNAANPLLAGLVLDALVSYVGCHKA